MNEDAYAVESLRKWFGDHKELFSSQLAVMEWREERGNSAFVTIETSCYVAQVSAWDNASCLDIFVADLVNDEEQMLHVGDCRSESEFHELLAMLLVWCRERCQ